MIRFEQVLDSVFGSLPADVTSFMKWKVEVKTSNGSHVERTDKTDSERIQLEVISILNLKYFYIREVF